MQNLESKFNKKLFEKDINSPANTGVESIKAFELMLKNLRFDLIIKYLYVKSKEEGLNTEAYVNLYKKHMRISGQKIFSGYNNRKKDFNSDFDEIIKSIKEKGFDEKISLITVNEDYEVIDGAHRLAAAAYFNKEIKIVKSKEKVCYDYKFFVKRGLKQFYCDFAALEYCNLDKNVYIINVQPITSVKFDSQIEDIIKKYGEIFYKKSINLNSKARLYTKIVSYKFDKFKGNNWIGDYSNDFIGAKNHVTRSNGTAPLRIYILKGLKGDVSELKKEIRDIINVENFAVHINDGYDEALKLAQAYFNENSLHYIKNVEIKEKNPFEWQFNYFRNWIAKNNLDRSEFCIDGSSVMTLYDLRAGDDLDFIHFRDNLPEIADEKISPHNKDLRHHAYSKDDIIFNPKNHLYHDGIKFISLEVLAKMKIKRNSNPKDIQDVKLIKNFLKKTRPTILSKIRDYFYTDLNIIVRCWRAFKRNPLRYPLAQISRMIERK